MTRAFADTSFYQALLNPSDAWHAPAVALSEHLASPIVTTEFVLIELGALMSRGYVRQLLVEFVAEIRSDPGTHVVPATGDLFAKGFDLFSERPDKDWLITDCISFVVMRQMRISDALSCDRHFEQAGFTQLLRRDSA